MIGTSFGLFVFAFAFAARISAVVGNGDLQIEKNSTIVIM